MQKLSEAPDRKRSDACTKKRNRLNKRNNLVSLSAVTSGVTIPKSFLLVVEGAMHPSLTCPRVAAASFTNHPRLKTPNN